MKYLIVIEPTKNGFSAYAPDVPGCVSAGATLEAVRDSMTEALEFHFDGLRIQRLPVPTPSSTSTFVDVPE